MTGPDPAALWASAEATWPPALARRLGPWTIRAGRGGGSRVSAASAHAPVAPDDIARAEAAMEAFGQVPLFQIRHADAALDARLAPAGYAVKDPVAVLAASAAKGAAGPLEAHWPPDPRQRAIWEAGGIGANRQAVMARAAGPKAALARTVDDEVAGTAFVAAHAGVAMLHALEVAERHRRKGIGRRIVEDARRWAAQQGAGHLALMVTCANAPARALYDAHGFTRVAGYHYRLRGGA